MNNINNPILEEGLEPLPRIMNYPHEKKLIGICCICNYVGHESKSCPLRPQYKFTLNKSFSRNKKRALKPIYIQQNPTINVKATHPGIQENCTS